VLVSPKAALYMYCTYTQNTLVSDVKINTSRSFSSCFRKSGGWGGGGIDYLEGISYAMDLAFVYRMRRSLTEEGSRHAFKKFSKLLLLKKKHLIFFFEFCFANIKLIFRSIAGHYSGLIRDWR
jgi:hypothetical protein